MTNKEKELRKDMNEIAKGDIPKKVAVKRYWYHANMIDVVNVLNQLHIISDRKAEKKNAKHAVIIFNDCLPRIFGEEVVANARRQANV